MAANANDNSNSAGGLSSSSLSARASSSGEGGIGGVNDGDEGTSNTVFSGLIPAWCMAAAITATVSELKEIRSVSVSWRNNAEIAEIVDIEKSE